MKNMSYERAIGLLKRCIETIDNHHETCEEVLNELHYSGFNNDEIKELGFEYLFDGDEE